MNRNQNDYNICNYSIGSSMLHELTVILAEFQIRHVVPPGSDRIGRNSESETLRTQRKVVHGKFGLGAKAVRTDQRKVVSAKKNGNIT